MRVRRNVSSASAGVITIGSFSSNEVFSTIGTPVSRSNSWISRWYRGFAARVTVCSRPVSSTWFTPGISSRLSARVR